MTPEEQKAVAAYRAGKAAGEALQLLSAKERAQVMRRLDLVVAVDQAPYGEKTSTARKLAEKHGLSMRTVERYHLAWKKDGIIALIDARGKQPSAVSQETREWITSLFISTGERCTRVYARILRQWRLWLESGDSRHAIPGYATCPPDSGKGHPRGLCFDSVRRLQPSLAMTSVVRAGRASLN